jgi:[acyl-carrier-protein] S-malonyltransferase
MSGAARAALFPGQGAQAAGMGRDLAEGDPEARRRFDRAGEVLGFDLARVCFEGPAEELTRSDRAQPAIFVVSIVCFEALRRRRPELSWAAAAGLSSGEWAALHAAGALSFEDALRVLQARGRLMQDACERQPGAMTSVIGLAPDRLGEVCARSGAEIANLNSAEQTVLSGRREAIEAAEKLATEAGARKVLRLNVAGAFHSSLMQPAADGLASVLAGVEFRAPSFPVLSNVTGEAHTTPDEIRHLMVRQVTGSVRWVDAVEWMKARGVTGYVECGPGKVLCGLVKRIDRSAVLNNISDLPSLGTAAAAL